MKLIVGLGNPGRKYAKTRHNAGWIVLDWFVRRSRHPELVSGSRHSGSSRFRNKFGMTIQQVKAPTSPKDSSWSENKRLKVLVYRSSDVIYAKPLTFMNSSGEAVRKLIDYYKIPLDNLLIIHDDLDLPLGGYRLQKGRGAAGHKGVQSVIDCMDSQDFWRLRIGIGRPSLPCHPELPPPTLSRSDSGRGDSGSLRSQPLRFRNKFGMTEGNETPESRYVLQNFSEEELKVLEELFESKLVSEIEDWIL